MFIETAAESAADRALDQWYSSQRGAWGFLPDYAGCFSYRPDVAKAWATFNPTIRGDAAVFAFATKVAGDASTIEQADVDELRAAGLVQKSAGLVQKMKPISVGYQRTRRSPSQPKPAGYGRVADAA
jgi:hypothetical protein